MWIIEDWAGNRLFPDKTFQTFEDGWDFIYANIEDTYNAYDDVFVNKEEENASSPTKQSTPSPQAINPPFEPTQRINPMSTYLTSIKFLSNHAVVFQRRCSDTGKPYVISAHMSDNYGNPVPVQYGAPDSVLDENSDLLELWASGGIPGAIPQSPPMGYFVYRMIEGDLSSSF